MALSFITAGATSAINGGNVTVTLGATPQAKDKIIVCYATTRALTMSVTSSSGLGYTNIVPTITNGNLVFSVWQLDVPTGLTTNSFVCTGTGNTQDATCAAGLVFRDGGFGGAVAKFPTSNSTTATVGTAPQGNAVTLASTQSIAISCFGQLAAEVTITAPTSYSNNNNANGSDTRSCAVGIAWISSQSGGSYTPTAWGSTISAAWTATTLSLTPNTTAAFVWLQSPSGDPMNHWRSIEIMPDGGGG